MMDTVLVLNNFRFHHFQFLLFVIFCSFLSSCNKNSTLKIGDQDVYAFQSQDSCNFITSNGLRISWKSAPPVNIIITSSVPAEYDSAILNAGGIWNSSKGRQLVHIYRDNSFSNPAGSDQTNAIYWTTSWDADQANQQARTSVRWDISKIKDADIRINAKNFEFYKDGDANTSSKVHMESLILHELGHVVGLGHIEDDKSVMQVYLKSETVRIEPGDVDTKSLSCEY